MNLEFFVRDQKITRKGLEPLVGDTAGFYTFSIEFDSVWDDLVKVVVFRNGADTAQMIYTGQSPLPASVSGRGDLYVACHGYRKKDDTVAVIRTIRMTRPVRLLGAEPMVGDDGQTFTPTLLDQVLSSCGDAKTSAKSAQDAAKSAQNLTAQLQQMVEQGVFHGKSASVVVEQVVEGEVPAVVNVGTERDVRLHITLPRGRNGDAGIIYSETVPRAEHHPLWVTPSNGVLWIWQEQQQCYEPLPVLTGKDGVDGKDGIDGKDGVDGKNGIDGRDGLNGRDGIDGKDGLNGKDGYTPIKGTDYYTEAEKQELVQQVVELVEAAEGTAESWNDLTDKPSVFPPAAHGHSYGELTNVPASFPPAAHGHSYTELTDKPSLFSGSWNDLTNKPTSFSPSSHSHSYTELTNKPTLFSGSWNDLTNKPSTFSPSSHSHSYTELSNIPATFQPASHNQGAATITAGTFAGQVVANGSGQTYSTSLLRNTKLVSADTNPTVNGEINWTYK